VSAVLPTGLIQPGAAERLLVGYDVDVEVRRVPRG
jgi:hypothetical protein